MSKRFKAVWGNDFWREEEREVGSNFFSKDVGYSSEDKAAIDALAVGQEWQSPAGTNHTVTRIS